MNHAPPNPKRPTPAAQRRQHEKLSKPFRPPWLIDAKTGNPSDFPLSNPDKRSSEAKNRTRSALSDVVVKSEAGGATKQVGSMKEENHRKHRTARAGAQFKSPLITGGSSFQATTPIRLTPTIQMLERHLEILKRAIRIKEDDQEGVLRSLTTKWIEAGREVASEVWMIVKDNLHTSSDDGLPAIRRKRSFQENWNWEMGDDKRHREEEDAYPHSGLADNELEETDTMGRVDLMRVPAEDGDPDRPRHTLGTMLRQLGIDPEILGWDDEEEVFKDISSEV